MKNILYKISGWMIIISGIIWIILNLYVNVLAELLFKPHLYEIVIGGLLGSLLIFLLSFFPGKIYINIGNKKIKKNKLSDVSVVLTIIGAVVVILAFITVLYFCGPGFCDGWGLLPLFFGGILPAAFFYAVAMILLTIYWFRKK